MKGLPLKFGQMASYIDGLAPPGYEEKFQRVLARLQQKAPPLSPEAAVKVIREDLGAHPREVFAAVGERAVRGREHRAGSSRRDPRGRAGRREGAVPRHRQGHRERPQEPLDARDDDRPHRPALPEQGDPRRDQERVSRRGRLPAARPKPSTSFRRIHEGDRDIVIPRVVPLAFEQARAHPRAHRRRGLRDVLRAARRRPSGTRPGRRSPASCSGLSGSTVSSTRILTRATTASSAAGASRSSISAATSSSPPRSSTGMKRYVTALQRGDDAEFYRALRRRARLRPERPRQLRPLHANTRSSSCARSSRTWTSSTRRSSRARAIAYLVRGGRRSSSSPTRRCRTCPRPCACRAIHVRQPAAVGASRACSRGSVREANWRRLVEPWLKMDGVPRPQ